jgi:beta-galactosidase/beta-glucuronidase
VNAPAPGLATPPSATDHDGSHPRPLLLRSAWLSLDGSWELAFDDDDKGRAARWQAGDADFPERIEVPMPPEAPASGLGDRAPHRVVWYRRRISTADLTASGYAADRRVLLHLGAVDYAAEVWLDGAHVASHVGGATPFTADLTDVLDPAREEHVLVVRAEDDLDDPDQARGKQDWRRKPRDIWYDRTTGIWQPVWLESVPADHVTELVWTPDVPGGVVRGLVRLGRRPAAGTRVEVTATYDGELLARTTVDALTDVVELDLRIDALRNAHERPRLLWSPEHPRLVDLVVRVLPPSLSSDSEAGDVVASYTGLRSVGVDGRGFLLNGHPVYTRAVLNQGFRAETHLAARDTGELRHEVEQIKELGFNCARLHQKCEDPRWMYWADRLGLMVWSEGVAHYAFSAEAVRRFTPEWTDQVLRDRSHPSVVAWVPVNESWGVPDVGEDPAQQSYVRGLAALTRALDPTRPVVSNEGWEHVDSDFIGLHDYTTEPSVLAARYATQESVDEVVLEGRTPHGRRSVVTDEQARAYATGDLPVLITEFGGISLSKDTEAWGYATVGSAEEYGELLRGLFDAVRASPLVSGFCYTQYLDTGQETNGLLYSDGTPKLPVERLREIVTGHPSA